MSRYEVADNSAIEVRRRVQLALATWASVIAFWAWYLIGPLAILDAETMSLTSVQTSLMIAAPILTGSLGRLVAGPMTDRFGGRIMFVVVSLAAIGPVLVVGFASAAGSFPLVLVSGFFLGIAGTVFAVGVPFVNTWYGPTRRGLAVGVFGMGMAGGAALSALFTPRLARSFGLLNTHLIIAAALGVTAVVCLVAMRNGPYFMPRTAPVLLKLKAVVRLRFSWDMAFLYAVVFGGYVAFANYLPTYIHNVYGFSMVAAGSRTAAFVLATVLSRPLGGMLADRIAPKYVVLTSLVGVAALAFVAVFQPPPDVWSGATFIMLAVSLGIGTGGLFAWVAQCSPIESVGTVTGIVSAAGGLGGYFLPLVMGKTYDPVHNDYTIGLLLLVATGIAAFAYTAARLPAYQRA